MARISGIDLPKNKRGEIGLTYIFGIGRSTAQKILAQANIDVNILNQAGRINRQFLFPRFHSIQNTLCPSDFL